MATTGHERDEYALQHCDSDDVDVLSLPFRLEGGPPAEASCRRYCSSTQYTFTSAEILAPSFVTNILRTNAILDSISELSIQASCAVTASE